MILMITLLIERHGGGEGRDGGQHLVEGGALLVAVANRVAQSSEASEIREQA